jgi:O-antigen ligase
LKYKQSFYRGIIPHNPLNKPILIFGIACLFSIASSLNPNHSQRIFFERYLMYAAIFWMAVGLTTSSKKNLYILTLALILSGFIFGLGGVRDYHYFRYVAKTPGMYDRIWTVFGRIIPFYGFPLYLTYFLPVNFIIAVFTKNKWLKVFCSIAAVLLFLCSIWNYTRATWISIPVSLLLAVFLKNRKLSLIIIFFLILLIISGFLFSKPVVKERIKNIVNPREWSFRLPLYKSSILIWKDYPISGVGIGMLKKVLHTAKYKLPQNYPIAEELTLHAHNTYLELGAEMGILGLLSFLFIFATFFKKSLKLICCPHKNFPLGYNAIFLGLFSSIIAILIFALSTSIITVGVNNSVFFWLLLGMCVGFINTNLNDACS